LGLAAISPPAAPQLFTDCQSAAVNDSIHDEYEQGTLKCVIIGRRHDWNSSDDVGTNAQKNAECKKIYIK
jgi:hypothetical protein